MQFEPDRMHYIAFALWLFGLYVWLRDDRSMDRYAIDAASQDEDAAASVGVDVTRREAQDYRALRRPVRARGAVYAQ